MSFQQFPINRKFFIFLVFVFGNLATFLSFLFQLCACELWNHFCANILLTLKAIHSWSQVQVGTDGWLQVGCDLTSIVYHFWIQFFMVNFIEFQRLGPLPCWKCELRFLWIVFKSRLENFEWNIIDFIFKYVHLPANYQKWVFLINCYGENCYIWGKYAAALNGCLKNSKIEKFWKISGKAVTLQYFSWRKFTIKSKIYDTQQY